MNDAILIKELTKSFDGPAAVNRLSLSVSKGEIFGLVGPDGAGKTTTMRLLTAILDPTSGEAWVAGHHIVKESEILKEKIGYMSQRFGLYPDLTVMENILFYADIYGVPRKGREEKINRLLSFSNLTPFKKRQAGNLSGGMKQKLGLACALIHTPEVLFLDEPTNGVDPVSRRDFWRILYQLLQEKVTIFLSTAYLDEAERCNRIGLIQEGNILALGTPEKVKARMRGTILEVRSDQPRPVTSLLREHYTPDSVGLFGDRIHLITEKPGEDSDKIEQLLTKGGFRSLGIHPVEPSLEDVFISVVSEHRENLSSRFPGADQASGEEGSR
jgi:ABC-2 type transport system ATP-binding protein